MSATRVLLFSLFATAALADTQFTVRQMTRSDVPSGKGQCDIRLRIDDEAEIELRGRQVFIHVLRGAEGSDEGSECNYPVPPNPQNLRFEKRDGRGDMRVLDETRRGVVVGIRDKDGGAGRYHFRLSWDDRGDGRFDDSSDNRRFPNRRQSGIFDDDRQRGGIFDDDRQPGGIFDDRSGDNRGRQGGNLYRNLRGDGSLRYRGRSDRLQRATLDVRNGGRFVLSVDGDIRETFEGTWRQGRRNSIDLQVDNARSGRVQGSGAVYLRGNEVERVTLNGREERSGQNFDLNFRVDGY